MTMHAKTSRAIVTQMREAVAAQMILIRELSAQIQMVDRRLRAVEAAPSALDEPLRRAVDSDPHLGRF
jgi:hypothetical protein